MQNGPIMYSVLLILVLGAVMMLFALNSKNADADNVNDTILPKPCLACFNGDVAWEKYHDPTDGGLLDLYYTDETIVLKYLKKIVALNSIDGSVRWHKKIQSDKEEPVTMPPCSKGILAIINDGSTQNDIPVCHAIMINPVTGDTLPVRFMKLSRSTNSVYIRFSREINNGLLLVISEEGGLDGDSYPHSELFFLDYSKIGDFSNDIAGIWFSELPPGGTFSIDNDGNRLVHVSKQRITLVPLKTDSHSTINFPLEHCRSAMCNSRGDLTLIRGKFKPEDEKKYDEIREKNTPGPFGNRETDLKSLNIEWKLEKKEELVLEKYSPEFKLIDAKSINKRYKKGISIHPVSEYDYYICCRDKIIYMTDLKKIKVITLPGNINVMQTQILGDNTFLVTSGKNIYHISTSGKITGKFTHTELFTGCPVVDDDGAIYCTTAKSVIKIR
jgi:hypothetical protein